ncbi:MAG: PadR family transcriptional regulator [Actinomycetota bacterium]|nr:PadR family transcriptional regulator [Actinomycetota bacterium]
MQEEIRLTPVSYIVLGLLSWAGEATPYDLKRLVASSVGNFWSLQHAQLYTEPERLTRAGLLTETREEGGRRRKRYRVTDAGRAALRAWLAEPTGELTELRDPGLLKLFFGADPAALARVQLESHRAKLAEYEELQRSPRLQELAGPRLALEAGIGHQREWIRFWERFEE